MQILNNPAIVEVSEVDCLINKIKHRAVEVDNLSEILLKVIVTNGILELSDVKAREDFIVYLSFTASHQQKLLISISNFHNEKNTVGNLVKNFSSVFSEDLNKSFDTCLCLRMFFFNMLLLPVVTDTIDDVMIYS